MADSLPSDKPTETVSVRISLKVYDGRLSGEVPVPAGPVRTQDVLPAIRHIADALVDASIQKEQAGGHAISCRAGCGACCRQLVATSEVEARRIRDLVNELPEPRRTEIRARYAAARQRLEEAGLLDLLIHPEKYSDDELRPLGLRYFRQGIACPFLEEESCSIYVDRPVACREYLVTTPAENCRDPSPEQVRRVPLAGKIGTALIRLGEDRHARFRRWVPLILAPQWADAHPDDLPPRPGPEILRSVLELLTGQDIPEPGRLA